MNEAAVILQLLRLPGIGPVKLRHIRQRLFQIGIPLQRIQELTDRQLQLDLHFSDDMIQGFRHPELDAEEDLHTCAEKGIQVLLPADHRYPLRLLDVLGRSAPALLFAQGNLELLDEPALGLSGARRAGEESLAATAALCEAAASQGWVIASGGARGVDEVAHLSAIRTGLGTIIVLPTGLLKPKLRKDLKEHLESGKTLLLSEFPPEQGWAVGCAMQRNRILTALSGVMTLVEPGLQGGTGGTGKIALSLGVPLFILQTPGAPGEGANGFLTEGAMPLSLDGPEPAQISDLLHRARRAGETARDAEKFQALFPE